MKFARYRGDVGESWGFVDAVESTIRRIGGPFEEWAPAATVNGPSVIENDGASVPFTGVKLLAVRVPMSEIAGVTNNYVSGIVSPKGSRTPESEQERGS